MEDGNGDREGIIFLIGCNMKNKGVERVVDGLQDPCREYSKLFLCDNRIEKLSASFLSYALKNDSCLTELSLAHNDIGNDGAESLAHALRFNGTLKMLNLEKNNIGPRGVAALSKCLERSNTTLQWMVLSENPIGDEGAKSLLRCVGNNLTIDTLLKCNFSLTSITLKKVTCLTSQTTLRKIQCYLTINRLFMPSRISLASQRKVLMLVKENHGPLLEYMSAIQGVDAVKDVCIMQILALLGRHCDLLSTLFALLKDNVVPSLLWKSPVTKNIS